LKPFEIYTDASTMHLGAVITQENRPIMFFSRTLSKTQTKYSVSKNHPAIVRNPERIPRNAVGASHKSLYRPHKSHPGCFILNFLQSVPLVAALRRICS
jgi:hypothetical protein